MNKVLKQMDYKGQTAVLSAILILVGMIFLVPAITEKALAIVQGRAYGTCGPEGQTHPCQFTFLEKELHGADASNVKWAEDVGCYDTHGSRVGAPVPPCDRVGWETRGFPAECMREAGHVGFLAAKVGCDELGSVRFKVGGRVASLIFVSPGALGSPAECEIKIDDAGPGKLGGSCNTDKISTAGLGTQMRYILHSAIGP